MQLPLQITFRGMDPSPAVEARIREKASTLDRYCDHIMSCSVVVETPHKHRTKGNLYHVRIHVTVPEGELVVSKETHDDHAREDVYVVIRDAFNALRRQLEDRVRQVRGDVKLHETPPQGRVMKLVPEMDYGIIETADNREIYFHRNSVLNNSFDQLELGSVVRFAEEMGEQGPQASTVTVLG